MEHTKLRPRTSVLFHGPVPNYHTLDRRGNPRKEIVGNAAPCEQRRNFKKQDVFITVGVRSKVSKRKIKGKPKRQEAGQTREALAQASMRRVLE